MEKKMADKTVIIDNKEKAGKAKEFDLESGLKNWKKQDLDKLNHKSSSGILSGPEHILCIAE